MFPMFIYINIQLLHHYMAHPAMASIKSQEGNHFPAEAVLVFQYPFRHTALQPEKRIGSAHNGSHMSVMSTLDS